MEPPDRPPLRHRSSAYRCEDAERDPRLDGHDRATRRSAWSTTCANARPARRRRDRDELPAVPRARAARPSSRTPTPSPSSSAPTSRWPSTNPLTREVRAALYRLAEDGQPVPRVVSRQRRARLPRRRRRRPRGGLRVAAGPRRAGSPRFRRARHPPSAGPPVDGTRAAAARAPTACAATRSAASAP